MSFFFLVSFCETNTGKAAIDENLNETKISFQLALMACGYHFMRLTFFSVLSSKTVLMLCLHLMQREEGGHLNDQIWLKTIFV